MSTKTILLTGGRAPATLDLARQLDSQDHRILLAESQTHYLSRVSNATSKKFQVSPPAQMPSTFIEDLKQIVIQEKVDLLIPSCEEVFYVSQGLKELQKHCRVLVDKMEILTLLHSKWEFNQAVLRMGLRAPQTVLVESQENLILESRNRPCVIKPVYSRFASKTFILQRGDNLPSNLVVSKTMPWVVQEFISGRELCTYSIAEQGSLLAHVTYSHDFTAGKGAGICFEAIEHPDILNWVKSFVEKHAFTGQIAFDFIESPQGELFPLECNPRATSGIHLFGRDASLGPVLFRDQDSLKTNGIIEIVSPKKGTAGMIGVAMFLFGLRSLKSISDFKKWVQIFFKSREVIFSIKDPLPFFYQFFCFFNLWWKSVVQRKNILEVSTQDIEWNGSL